MIYACHKQSKRSLLWLLLNKSYLQILFVITAAVLMAALVTVALYTVNAANAQGTPTGAAGANMTKNATGAIAGAVKNATD